MFTLGAAEFNAHVVEADDDGPCRGVAVRWTRRRVRINGGFFVLKREIFDQIEPGEELVVEPFARLIERGELIAYRYDGFFGPMDTIKDRQRLEGLNETGQPPVARVGRRRPNRPSLMLPWPRGGEPLRRVLALGAHADDIEIGCGGTFSTLIRAAPR